MSNRRREIEELRRQIALLDAQLLAGLDERARASKAIGSLLEAGQPPPLSLHGRPQIEALIARGSGDMPSESLRVVFRDVFAACLGLEAPATVVYLGPEGGAGLSVARKYFGSSASLVARDSATSALEEVTRLRADYAVLPYETSSEGPVPSTIAALTATELRISLVLEASPSLHLFSCTGVAKEIQTIYATSGDRGLARNFLAALGPLPAVDVDSPLVACRRAAEDPAGGALASEGIGVQTGLEVAQRNVLDRGQERVRYAVVGSRPSSRTGEDFTAIVFTLTDSPGSLMGVLRQFADRGINLSKIQSRPVEAEPWSYLFFLEATGHGTDRHLVSAFEEVRRLTKFMRILGSYPVSG